MNSLQDKIKTLFFVPVSDWLASLLKESKQAHRPSIVIHNGVDLSVFKPMNTKVTSPYILGVAAVWDERKGLNDFVRLRKMLPQECMIKLVGLTDRQIQELPEGIQGIQRTANREELARLYAEASVFVNPTYSDNFPTTNIEALACGTPVVTYRTGGSPEAVDEQTGIVIKQGDIEGLLQAISTIVAQGKDAYVNNCRNRAEKYFNNKIKYKDYIDLYNMLLAKNTEYQAIIPPHSSCVRYQLNNQSNFNLACRHIERRLAA
jgi:glycosyltransferase involved in cell wall biosynthesis